MLLICVDSNESNLDLHCTEMNMDRSDIPVPKLSPWHCLTTLLCVCGGGGGEGLTRLHVDVHACLSLVVAHPCNKYGCISSNFTKIHQYHFS